MIPYPDETWTQYADRYREGWSAKRDKLRMGTSAMGGGKKRLDISRDDEDYFHVDSETEHFYIGSWITGFGFFDVAFPKATSRPLTDEEFEWFLDNPVTLG